MRIVNVWFMIIFVVHSQKLHVAHFLIRNPSDSQFTPCRDLVVFRVVEVIYGDSKYTVYSLATQRRRQSEAVRIFCLVIRLKPNIGMTGTSSSNTFFQHPSLVS